VDVFLNHCAEAEKLKTNNAVTETHITFLNDSDFIFYTPFGWYWFLKENALKFDH